MPRPDEATTEKSLLGLKEEVDVGYGFHAATKLGSDS